MKNPVLDSIVGCRIQTHYGTGGIVTSYSGPHEQFDDLDALASEVERLTDLSRQNYCKFVRQQEECDRLLRRAEDAESKNATLEKALALMIDRIHKPRTTEEAKDQQIATLKKALELMHADAESSIGSFIPDEDEFIQQAQEQEAGK